MIYVKSKLDKSGKKASDFINWLCDNTRNHNLEKHKGKELIKIKRNGIDGKLYIDPVLKDKLIEFINL